MSKPPRDASAPARCWAASRRAAAGTRWGSPAAPPAAPRAAAPPSEVSAAPPEDVQVKEVLKPDQTRRKVGVELPCLHHDHTALLRRMQPPAHRKEFARLAGRPSCLELACLPKRPGTVSVVPWWLMLWCKALCSTGQQVRMECIASEVAASSFQLAGSQGNRCRHTRHPGSMRFMLAFRIVMGSARTAAGIMGLATAMEPAANMPARHMQCR